MSRLIDHEPNTRTKPMRVLCMGMARTGTNCMQLWYRIAEKWCANIKPTSTAMTIALRKLGLNPYHGSECFKNPPRDFNLWIEALECNFFNDNEKNKKRYGREEFDRFIGSYDAILDVPACVFWSDLHAAYPDAKIILTTRDVDSWLKSANKTVFKFVQMPFFRVWQYLDTTCIGPLFRQSDLVWRVFCGRNYDEEVLKRAYFEHHERIRKSIPKEQLLEFHTGKDGWEKLCGFLDVPMPQEPWPNAYPTAEFQEHIDVALRQARWTITRWIGVGVGVVMGVAGWSYLRGVSLEDL